MKNAIIILLLLTLHLPSFAQQLNSSSFYELHGVLHNPASVGSKKQALIGGSFKTQWSSMPGSPKTGLFYGQTFLPLHKIGVGGYLYHDVTGPTSRTGLQLAYAYHVSLDENRSFSLGMEARLQQLSFDRVKLQAELGGLDPVAVNVSNRLKADAGFGIAYTTQNLQIGAAVSQLVQSKYNFYDQTGTTGQSQLYRHWYLHGNYQWQPDDATKVIPHALLLYLPNAPLEMQAGVRIDHNDLFWYDLGWRKRQGWMMAAGLKVKEKFSIGYSFDLYSSPLTIYEKGSTGHELLLQYELSSK